MSQNPLALPTTGTLPGLQLVEDVNAAIDTLNTLSSGGTAPSSPEAGQLWHDTGTNVLWLRDQANTTWIALLTLDETDKKSFAVGATIAGLVLSGGGTSTLSVAAGNVLSDDLSMQIVFKGGYTKTFSSFAIGSGNGALDTGTVANSTWYSVFAILNPATGVSDILVSTSATTPSLPTGFTHKSWIGAVRINGSGVIMPFVQSGNEFLYAPGAQDVGYASASTAATLCSLTVPPGIKVEALVRAAIENTTGSIYEVLLYAPDETAQTPTINPGGGTMNASLSCQQASGGINATDAGHFTLRTNTSGQIGVVSSFTAAGAYYGIWTRGFVAARGPQ